MKILIMILCFTAFVTSGKAQESLNVGSSCSDLSVTGIKSKENLLKFLGDLKTAVLSKDVNSISKFVLFPLQVNAKSKKKIIKNQADLKKEFTSVFTETVLKAIANQEAERIFCRNQGAMIGDGEVWIRQKNEQIGISTINP